MTWRRPHQEGWKRQTCLGPRPLPLPNPQVGGRRPHIRHTQSCGPAPDRRCPIMSGFGNQQGLTRRAWGLCKAVSALGWPVCCVDRSETQHRTTLKSTSVIQESDLLTNLGICARGCASSGTFTRGGGTGRSHFSSSPSAWLVRSLQVRILTFSIYCTCPARCFPVHYSLPACPTQTCLQSDPNTATPCGHPLWLVFPESAYHHATPSNQPQENQPPSRAPSPHGELAPPTSTPTAGRAEPLGCKLTVMK